MVPVGVATYPISCEARPFSLSLRVVLKDGNNTYRLTPPARFASAPRKRRSYEFDRHASVWSRAVRRISIARLPRSKFRMDSRLSIKFLALVLSFHGRDWDVCRDGSLERGCCPVISWKLFRELVLVIQDQCGSVGSCGSSLDGDDAVGVGAMGPNNRQARCPTPPGYCHKSKDRASSR